MNDKPTNSTADSPRTPLGNAKIGLPLILGLCIATYINGLFGGFVFDDYPNIVNNKLLQGAGAGSYDWSVAALSSDSGLLKRPVSMLSFAANVFVFGMNPVAFKVVNLLIHLMNGVLIYAISLRLIPLLCRRNPASAFAFAPEPINARRSALFVSALWLLHPLHVSDVLYIVQRMNELASLFTLAGLLCYIEGRKRTLEGAPGLIISLGGLLIFGVLALLSKENGALIFLYAFVLEITCFRFAPKPSRWPLSAFFLTFLALPVGVFCTYLLTHPDWLAAGYSHRNFSLSERLLTEPRILLRYVQWIFVPLPSSLGLYHDDIPLSTGLFSPATTIVAILSWASAAVIAWTTRSRVPAISFGVTWFLAGHAMESTVLPLELVFEHRNYLPMLGPIVGCVALATQISRNEVSATAATVVFASIVSALAVGTAVRAYTWGDPIRLALVSAEDHPRSPRSLYDAARATIHAEESAGTLETARGPARDYIKRAMSLDQSDPGLASSYLLTFWGSRPIPESAVAELERRLHSALSFHSDEFLLLLKALGDGRIVLPLPDVERLVTAALGNPAASRWTKAMVLNHFGRYQFVIQHDAQTAVQLTLAAAATAPRDPYFRISLANLALALGDTGRARAALSQAEALDAYKVHQSDIQETKNKLRDWPANR